IAVHRSGEALASWVENRFGHVASNLGHRIALRIREFRSGLNTIHNKKSLLLLIGVSVLMWAIIAVAYKEVTHAYGAEKLEIPQTQVLLLMGSSMVGSLIQLPGVGGDRNWLPSRHSSTSLGFRTNWLPVAASC